MRYEVHRLLHSARFAPRDISTRSFDAVVIDTDAKRPTEREICVAPWDVANQIATLLNIKAKYESGSDGCLVMNASRT